MKAKQASFWEQLENLKITGRGEIEQYLLTKLGNPITDTQQNLLFELLKKLILTMSKRMARVIPLTL
jgi:hypothetical protein